MPRSHIATPAPARSATALNLGRPQALRQLAVDVERRRWVANADGLRICKYIAEHIISADIPWIFRLQEAPSHRRLPAAGC